MPCEISERLKAWLNEPRSLVIIGVGNIVRGDDGIGAKVAEHLEKYTSNRMKVINCEEAPENFIAQVVSHEPSHVLIIDAVDFGEEPGSMRLVEPKEMKDSACYSTHHIPLNLIAELIRLETGSNTAILGIQPSQTTLGSGLSLPVKESYERVIRLLEEAFRSLDAAPSTLE